MMEKLGIVRRSKSQYASPLHMVTKPDGTWRPCGDFKRLNAITRSDRYPIPHVHDLTAALHGSLIFSKLDLAKGYFQIPVADSDIHKTAIITPFGLFEFLRMPFGLCNAAQSFQRFMDAIIGDLENVFVYIDDILIATPDEESHMRTLNQVCQRLAQHGLVLNFAKCKFGCREIDFLGHTINHRGIQPTRAKIEDVENFPRPVDKKGLLRFLGMVNYYHRFIPNAARILGPLHHACSAVKKNPSPIQWTDAAIGAFEDTKRALVQTTLLTHPDPAASLAVTVDASDTAMGAVLEQWRDGGWLPLSFMSVKLTPAQVKYSAFDKELLAAYTAVRKFSHYLEGRRFVIYTDHKPLTFAMVSSTRYSPRQERHLSYLAEFTTDIRHVSGRDNVVADALSRPVNAAKFVQPVDEVQMSLAQASDPEIHAMRTSSTSLRFSDISIPNTDTTILCDTSLRSPRPVVPKALRQKILHQIHDLGHPGIRTTRKLVTERFVWHGMCKDIAQFVRSCHSCAASKVQKHNRATLSQFPQPTARLQHVHVDIVGPLPVSRGYKYLLTVIDRYTRWPTAIPMSRISAEDCTDAFLSGWVSLHGAPEIVTSDRGRQFTSNLWKDTLHMLGSKVQRTTAYHPQANGMIERFHRHLKAALKARAGDWASQLPLVLLALRSMPKEDLGATPSELLYGTTLRLPGDLVIGNQPINMEQSAYVRELRAGMKRLANVPPMYHDRPKSYLEPSLSTAKFVYVRRDAVTGPLDQPYEGPYFVIAHGDKTFLIERNSRADRISVDRLKPAFSEPRSVTAK